MQYLPNGLSAPAGQDPGSSETMNALMQWIQRQQAGAGAASVGQTMGTADAWNGAASAGATDAAVEGSSY